VGQGGSGAVEWWSSGVGWQWSSVAVGKWGNGVVE